MTTHGERATTAAPQGTEVPEFRDADTTEPARREDVSGAARAARAARAETSSDDNTLLFADEHRTGLHSRWNEVQAAFVDDPKGSVQDADNLVAEIVDELTASFADTRSRLEAQWGRGEDASTEDLRVALQRYRDFFQRLLSV